MSETIPNVNVNFVLDQLEAEYTAEFGANDRSWTITVRTKIGGKELARERHQERDSAIKLAVAKAAEAVDAKLLPVSKDEASNKRLAMLEKQMADVLVMLRAMQGKINSMAQAPAQAARPAVAPIQAAITDPAKIAPPPDENSDDALRQKLKDAGVEVSDKWSRKRLMAECTDRGLLNPPAKEPATSPATAPPPAAE